ncbi:MAG: hypothetical protein JO187_03430, partial [Acidobacteria bacterium]|nr:hypothetical protein [Acidobacteriota bacterium]
IQAGVTVPDAVWADANYVYLANFDGRLRVIDERQSGFPVIADIPMTSQLFSVRGDAASVYATGTDGMLFRFSNQPPFATESSTSYATIALNSLDVDQSSTGSIFVSQGSGQSAADSAHVYVTSLNPGEGVLAISKATGQVITQYEENPVDPSVTAVFDRSSGARIGTIQNPTTNSGGLGAAAIYSQAGVLAIFTPGCCGRGVYLYDASSLAPLGGGSIQDPWVDTVALVKNWLIVGTEAGTVDVFDISNRAAIQPSLAPVASINLRTVTGKTGIEDIEIRAIWAEDTGSSVRIYAGSSWGNSSKPADYRAQLPSFFVLDLK